MRVKLDIANLPEELYDKLLEEFRRVYGTGHDYYDWEITAQAEKKESEDEQGN